MSSFWLAPAVQTHLYSHTKIHITIDNIILYSLYSLQRMKQDAKGRLMAKSSLQTQIDKDHWVHNLWRVLQCPALPPFPSCLIKVGICSRLRRFVSLFPVCRSLRIHILYFFLPSVSPLDPSSEYFCHYNILKSVVGLDTPHTFPDSLRVTLRYLRRTTEIVLIPSKSCEFKSLRVVFLILPRQQKKIIQADLWPSLCHILS